MQSIFSDITDDYNTNLETLHRIKEKYKIELYTNLTNNLYSILNEVGNRQILIPNHNSIVNDLFTDETFVRVLIDIVKQYKKNETNQVFKSKLKRIHKILKLHLNILTTTDKYEYIFDEYIDDLFSNISQIVLE